MFYLLMIIIYMVSVTPFFNEHQESPLTDRIYIGNKSLEHVHMEKGKTNDTMIQIVAIHMEEAFSLIG